MLWQSKKSSVKKPVDPSVSCLAGELSMGCQFHRNQLDLTGIYVGFTRISCMCNQPYLDVFWMCLKRVGPPVIAFREEKGDERLSHTDYDGDPCQNNKHSTGSVFATECLARETMG